MRSSKSRSRSKSNRQRSIGNIINRVFDSSGPEGKVRGTPQQIIEKYLMLARDAQLGNDRVAEQNFLQHAEHYTRLLGEAQAELAREQAARQAMHGGGQPWQQGGNGNGGSGEGRPQQQGRDRDDRRYDRDAPRDSYPQPEERGGNDEAPVDLPAFLRAPQADAADDGPGLVETPEARSDAPARSREEGGRSRGPRRPRSRRDDVADEGGSDDTSDGPATDGTPRAAE